MTSSTPSPALDLTDPLRKLTMELAHSTGTQERDVRKILNEIGITSRVPEAAVIAGGEPRELSVDHLRVAIRSALAVVID